MKGSTKRIEQVILAPSAAMTIRDEALRSVDGNETGGLLLGQVDTDATAWVRSAGDPGPAAVHRPAFFLRDLHHAQRLAAEAFARDGSESIGEWHTHPDATPTPSARDRHTYLRFLTDPQLCFDAFVALIIVAPAGVWHQPEAHAWVCSHRVAEHVPLTITSDSTVRPTGETR
ncbi:MAG: Mov34/MPN/PAD-1 family protein [Pseudonocardiaceae bacterium]